MSEDIFHSWAVVTVLTLVATTTGLLLGFKGKGTLVQWRLVKLLSTVSGLFAILFLLLNYEALARNVLANDAEWIFSQKYERELLEGQWVHCYRDVRNAGSLDCAAMKKITNESSASPVGVLDKANYSPSLAGTIDKLNAIVSERRADRDPKWSPSPKTRMSLFFLAALLVGLSLGGSIGEAAFQYRLALDAERRGPRT